MKKLFSQIVSAIFGLWLATMFISGVIVKIHSETNVFGYPLTEKWEIFLALGVILGSLNYFIRPLARTLSLPLEFITAWLMEIVLSVAFLWFLDMIFDELYVPWFLPLLYTALMIWALNLIIQKLLIRNYYE